jgi:hypothetical protein
MQMSLFEGKNIDGDFDSLYSFREKMICSYETIGSLPYTTSLVSSRTESLDLIGLKKPENEILKEPEQHLPMHVRQRATRD